jgi:hypothetical protein
MTVWKTVSIVLRLLARAYTVLVLLILVWGWAMEIALYGQLHEHLLPMMLLAAASMPTSILIERAGDWTTAVVSLFPAASSYLAMYSIAAVIQMAAVWILVAPIARRLDKA